MHDAREDEQFRHGGIKFSQCTPAEPLAALFWNSEEFQDSPYTAGSIPYMTILKTVS